MLLELQGLCLILLISVSSLLTQSLQTSLRYALINIVGSLFFLYGVVRYVLLTSNSLFYIQLIKLDFIINNHRV
jgi:NADH:ubiquinone oxidoreductase subunit 2 (subunit N)